jgi:signal transduction histidine kinase
MTMSLRNWFPEVTAFLLAVVIVITATLASEYNREVAQVQRALDVEKRLAKLLSAVQDAETGVRGFHLTGDEEFLGVYDISQRELPEQLADLRKFISDPEQIRKLAELEPIIADRIVHLQEGIRIRRELGLEAAAKFVQEKRGLNLMRQVRAGIADMERIERELYIERFGGTQSFIKWTMAAAAASIALAAVSVAAWIWSGRLQSRRLAAEAARRRRAEAQMRQLQKVEALGQLTSGVAHDFNNMLAVIKSGLSLIKKQLQNEDAEIASVIDATADGADRAAALTSRLMAFARQQPLEAKPVDPGKLVDGLADLLHRTLGPNVEFRKNIQPDGWNCLLDPAQFESAILNLCVNARDAMPDGGPLTLSTRNVRLGGGSASAVGIDPGDYVHVAVSDAGVGMPPDVVARAFDPFFTTKEPGKGTGLGLSQVYDFVTKSDGHIGIDSQPGNGTVVNMHFKRHEAAA